jgi:hypothetical protein
MITPTPILDYVQERLSTLRVELEECKQAGVNSPGFNQTLGALDELQFLLDAIAEM